MSAFAAATSSPAGHHPRLFFWRENRNDGAYSVPGNLIRPVRGATARHVGSQPAVMLTVSLGRHLTVAVGWAYFIAVPFLRESGPASNGTYLGSWVTFVF